MAMIGVGDINLKVLLMDTDFYALRAVNSYLAWDRRTRVTHICDSEQAMWHHIEAIQTVAELPHVVVLDPDHVGGAQNLKSMLRRLRQSIDHVLLLCLGQTANPDLLVAAADGGASGYLLKHEIRLQIASAIIYAYTAGYDFIATTSMAQQAAQLNHQRLYRTKMLPGRREYPELTDRIRQAIELCVVEGMPAHLAADEMGISLHTIRGYIKEGYRILEAHDDTEYPVDLTPQERAFMRFTAFEDE